MTVISGYVGPWAIGGYKSVPTAFYIENPAELEDPQTIDQANAQIATLGTLVAKGEIDD